ncbi:MAG: hypothetical protein FJ091_13990 [Deltaproteobacteria bacterium]|nr:hypothetical protein [Deltaproteobacteria bacterium]
MRLGDGVYYGGDPDAALAHYRAADEVIRAASPRFPSSSRLLRLRMLTQWSVATTLHALARIPEALPIFDEAVAVAERLRVFEDLDHVTLRNRSVTRQARAEAWLDAGRVADAIPELEAIARHYRAEALRLPGDPGRRRDLASCSVVLGRARIAAGDAEGGCRALSEASEIYRTLIREGALMPGDALEAIPSLNAHAKPCEAAGVRLAPVER